MDTIEDAVATAVILAYAIVSAGLGSFIAYCVSCDTFVGMILGGIVGLCAHFYTERISPGIFLSTKQNNKQIYT